MRTVSSPLGRLDAQQWAALDDNVSGELVTGALSDEEVADFIHDLVVAWILAVVGPWVFERGGLAAASETKLGVTEDGGRKPDACFYLPGAAKPSSRGLVTTPPSVVVEVVSPSPRDARRDRVDKLHEYAAFGVAWYWLVDPQLRTFEVLELGDDGRYVHAVAETSGIVPIPGCDGLDLDLGDLWNRIDQLESDDTR